MYTISLEGIAEWLRGEDPATRFNYCDSSDCLLHRYLRSIGAPVKSVDPCGWTDTKGERHHDFPYEWNELFGSREGAETWTYGVTLARIEEYLAREKERTGAGA